MDSFERLVWKYDNPGKLKRHVWVNLIVVIYLGHCQIKDKWPWKNDPEKVEIGTYGAVLISNISRARCIPWPSFWFPWSLLRWPIGSQWPQQCLRQLLARLAQVCSLTLANGSGLWSTISRLWRGFRRFVANPVITICRSTLDFWFFLRFWRLRPRPVWSLTFSEVLTVGN